VITDPTVSFWLHYVEREGALVENDGPASALAVLPSSLRARHELPEELVVTADPDVAREDGAVLLSPGHPLVEQSAYRVLDDGDVGVGWLPWPGSALPGRDVLEARARDCYPVDHGRIDVIDAPHAVYLPVLRAATMVTYEVSLDVRFQERAEVWVDATTGRPFSAQVTRRLQDRFEPTTERAARPPLKANLETAIRSVATHLRSQATARLGDLEDQSAQARDEELARAGSYYDAAFASIHRRRATASADRAALLDAQAEVTRREQERRVAEIHEKFRPRYGLRPFRLHLLFVPALWLSVRIRRGPRAYPWELVWLLPAGAFSPVACPHCGSSFGLVAGRNHLGCRSCVPRGRSAGAPA
jgi:hypothetical protein